MAMVSTDAAGQYGGPAHPVTDAPIQVERWPSEIPLLFFTGLVSAAVWLLAAVTIIGLLYAMFLAAFFFVGVLMNAISRSTKERRMALLALALGALSVVVALGA